MLFKTYNKLPSKIKHSIKKGYSLLPLHLRLGKKFFTKYDFLEQSQWWDAKQLKEYQNIKLKKLVRHALANVPYYQKIFSQLSLTLDDINTIDDLQKLPILTKSIIRDNFQELKAQNFSENNILELSTSGTTGTPLKFLYDKSKDYLTGDPYIWRFFGWGGQTLSTLSVKLADWTLDKNKTSYYNPNRNLLILSTYSLKQENINEYAEALKQYEAEYIDCYPSSMVLLTRFLQEMNISHPVKLKAIFSHSEVLHSWQRKILEQYWGCKCFNWYGMEERAILGIECEQHTDMHLCSDFAITEFIKDNSLTGDRIITTSLTNYAMPFIRYDTGDVGKLKEELCSCNRAFPLFELHGGRDKSFAIGKDGSSIPIANIDIPNASDNIVQFQFTQEEIGQLSLNIIKNKNFAENDLDKIRANLNQKFHDNMDIDIYFSKAVQKNSNGKTAIFIQKIRSE